MHPTARQWVVTETFGAGAAFYLATQVYPVLKAIDPNIIVEGETHSGINNGMTAAYINGGGLKYANQFPYQQYNPANAENAMRGLATQEQSAAASVGASSHPLLVTEIGFPTYSGTGGTTEAAAASPARLYLLASAPEVPYMAL